MTSHPLQTDTEKSLFPSSLWLSVIYWRAVIIGVREMQMLKGSLEVSYSTAVASSPSLQSPGPNNPVLSFLPRGSYFLDFH